VTGSAAFDVDVAAVLEACLRGPRMGGENPMPLHGGLFGRGILEVEIDAWRAAGKECCGHPRQGQGSDAA